MSRYLALVEELEVTAEGSIELDRDIWWLVDRPNAQRCFWNASTGKPGSLPLGDKIPDGLGRLAVELRAPHYTRSIDGALALVPAGWEFTCLQKNGYNRWYAQVCDTTGKYRGPSGGTCVFAEHGDRKIGTNKYLALCMAMLKAQAEAEKLKETASG